MRKEESSIPLRAETKNMNVFQRWNCSQDDQNSAFKYAKCENPHLLGRPAPPNSHLAHRLCTSGPENGPHQHPAPHAQTAPEFTLFHWQIQREMQKVGGLSPELLVMQDADDDTYVGDAGGPKTRMRSPSGS